MADCQVDGRSNKAGRDDQTAHLQPEALVAPWIVMQHDAASISKHLEYAASADCKGVAPELVFPDEREMCDREDSEES